MILFLDDQLMNLASVDETPWFADIANYLASGVLPTGLSAYYSKKFFYDLRYYYLRLVQTACCAVAFLRLRYILSQSIVMICLVVDIQLLLRPQLRSFNVDSIGPHSLEMCRPMSRLVIVANEIATYLRLILCLSPRF